MKKALILSVLSMLCLSVAIFAANHRSQPLSQAGQYTTGGVLQGYALFYTGTTSAKTFQFDDAYATNVFYTNMLGSVVFPKATNSVTGGLVPSWSVDGNLWANSFGDPSTPNISVTLKGNATLTNTVTFNFIRSADGVNFGTGTQDTFSFTVTPTTTAVTTITNLPATFVTGTKTIRPYTIVCATNAVDTGALTIQSMSLNGYVP